MYLHSSMAYYKMFLHFEGQDTSPPDFTMGEGVEGSKTTKIEGQFGAPASPAMELDSAVNPTLSSQLTSSSFVKRLSRPFG